MAPRAYWKGYLRLSLVSCPIALYPATSAQEKVRFHQINKATGHRIKYLKVDAETEEPVASDAIVKGYEIDKGAYLEVSPNELAAIDIESTRTIEIDSFVARAEIDTLYLANPYYIVPDGKVGEQAYAVIRTVIENMKMAALGRVVFSTREHVLALEPRDKGLLGTTLRYPYEVRDAREYFDDIAEQKLPKDMIDLAAHIVKTKQVHFDPSTFEDRYENAVVDLLKRKQAGQKITAQKHERPSNVVSLMDALRRSVKAEKGTSDKQARTKPKRKAMTRRKLKSAS